MGCCRACSKDIEYCAEEQIKITAHISRGNLQTTPFLFRLFSRIFVPDNPSLDKDGPELFFLPEKDRRHFDKLQNRHERHHEDYFPGVVREKFFKTDFAVGVDGGQNVFDAIVDFNIIGIDNVIIFFFCRALENAFKCRKKVENGYSANKAGSVRRRFNRIPVGRSAGVAADLFRLKMPQRKGRFLVFFVFQELVDELLLVINALFLLDYFSLNGRQ
jgi:hypothetical protein